MSALLVERIAAWRLDDGKSVREIYRELRRSKVTTNQGKPWTIRRLRRYFDDRPTCQRTLERMRTSGRAN